MISDVVMLTLAVFALFQVVLNRLSWQRVWAVEPAETSVAGLSWRPDGRGEREREEGKKGSIHFIINMILNVMCSPSSFKCLLALNCLDPLLIPLC